MPKGDAFIIRSRSQVGAIGGVTNDIGIFVSFTETVQDAKVVIIGVQRSAIVYDLPYFDASLSTFSFLLHKLFFIRTCRGELIREGMEVNRKDAVLLSMPADVGGVNAHKLAVDYIL